MYIILLWLHFGLLHIIGEVLYFDCAGKVAHNKSGVVNMSVSVILTLKLIVYISISKFDYQLLGLKFLRLVIIALSPTAFITINPFLAANLSESESFCIYATPPNNLLWL